MSRDLQWTIITQHSFIYLRIEVTHHARIVVWFPFSLIDVVVEAIYVFF